MPLFSLSSMWVNCSGERGVSSQRHVIRFPTQYESRWQKITYNDLGNSLGFGVRGAKHKHDLLGERTPARPQKGHPS